MDNITLTVNGAVVFQQTPPPIPPNPALVNQFFDRLLTPPSPAYAALYTALINSLVTSGIWPLLKAFYLLAAHDPGTALINLVSPNFQAFLSLVNGVPTFAPGLGFSNCVNPITTVDTNFNPLRDASDLQNSFLLATYVQGTAIESKAAVAVQSSVIVDLWPDSSSNQSKWNVNGPSDNVVANATGPSGFWAAQRTAVNASELYHGGAILSSSPANSVTPPNADIVVMTAVNTTSAIVIGQSLTLAQLAILENAIATAVATAGTLQ